MQQNNAAKFAFFYMLSLVALTFMSIATGMIAFQLINKFIVDVISRYTEGFSASQLKFAISALIVATPIYYFTTRQIYKNLFSGSLDKDSGVRKWLTYFILLVSLVVMIGWMIGVINSFLDGELTVKFILKAITAIGISGAIFSFYLYDVKREIIVNQPDKVIKIYFFASLAVILGFFIASLFIVESPAMTRDRKYDSLILENFSQLDSALQEYYWQEGKLPADLVDLKNDYGFIGDKTLINPITNENYEYKAVEENRYELCTTFRTDNTGNDEDVYYTYKDRWPHGTGYQCLGQKVKTQNELLNMDAKRIPEPVMIQ